MRLLLLAIAAVATLTGSQGPSSIGGAAPSSWPCVNEPVDGVRRPLAGTRQLQFVPNLGQWQSGEERDAVRFAALGDTAGWLHDDGFTLRFERWSQEHEREPGRSCSGAIVRTRFVGAATTGFEVGAEFATRHHFLRGDVHGHVRDVPAYEAVTMRSVLPGIDVHYRALPSGDGDVCYRGPFEYDLLLSPGADLESFVAECDGVDHLRIDAEGRLVASIQTPQGPHELVQQAPIAWQETADGKQPITVRFRLLGARRYGFAADPFDSSLLTIVDPGVVWGSFLGGGVSDRIHDMKWSPGAGVWVAGWTGSTDFPSTVGAFQEVGNADGFVAQLTDDGQSLVFATYLGGVGGEEVRAIALAGDQTATVVGFTDSADFPVTAGAAQMQNAGGSVFLEIGDAFVTRLSADGSGLLGSTFAGGQFDDVAEDVTLDANGDAVVIGWTSSADFPMPSGGYQPALGGMPIIQSDGFVLKVAQNARAFSFGTFLGGQSGEQLLGVDIDSVSGDVAVTGWSIGADYPVTPNVVRPSSGGDIDAVLTRLSADLSTAVFSTYMGGIGEDAAQALKFDVDGSVWIGGFTDSTNYPTTPLAPQQSLGGEFDGFVTRISSLGQSLVYSTLLGGSGQDRVRDLDLANPGMLVVGEAGVGFPVTQDAVQAQFVGGVIDSFATFLTSSGATLSWSSYFGGAGQDSLQAVEFTDGGLAIIAGYTYSSEFPIHPAAYQGQMLGVEDGVVMQLDLLTDLGPGMQVESTGVAEVELVGSGDAELLTFDLLNIIDRAIAVDAVRVFIAGAGTNTTNVTNVRVLRDFADGFGTELVGGPSAILPGDETELILNDVILPPQSTTSFVVTATVMSDPNGASVEVAAAIVDASAWSVHALGFGNGPAVGVSGVGRATGSVFVLGSIAGDIDGSGARTVLDVRRLIHAVGTFDATTDTDGDGVLTMIDVGATSQALLGRGTVFSLPAQISRGDWLLVRCLLPMGGAVQTSLGGRSLAIGRTTPRQLSLRVDGDQPVGLQELVIQLNGSTVFTGLVDVY